MAPQAIHLLKKGMDIFSSAKRSEIMSSVKGKNTKPELIIRKLLHAAGYRYRVNFPGLVGTPDIVFTRKRKVIFIHGCFWHQHPNCSRATVPKSNRAFWESKFNKTIKRDKNVCLRLQEEGWEVLTLWECEINRLKDVELKLRSFLGSTRGK